MIIKSGRPIEDSDISPKMAQRSPKKKTLEKDIQREICDWLYSQGTFFWRNNNTPIFQPGGNGRAGRFRAMPKYSVKGLPDIMCISHGRFIGLEVKVPGYWKRTDAQIDVKDKFIDNGAYYSLVTSLQEAQDYFKGINK